MLSFLLLFPNSSSDLSKAEPTLTHMCIRMLHKENLVCVQDGYIPAESNYCMFTQCLHVVCIFDCPHRLSMLFLKTVMDSTCVAVYPDRPYLSFMETCS